MSKPVNSGPVVVELKIPKPRHDAVAAAGGKRVLIIEGIRENGGRFRPSDWAERISSSYAAFGKDHRLHYSPSVCPRVFNGQQVLAVELALRERNPEMFRAIIQFARDNSLRTREEVELQD